MFFVKALLGLGVRYMLMFWGVACEGVLGSDFTFYISGQSCVECKMYGLTPKLYNGEGRVPFQPLGLYSLVNFNGRPRL